MSIVKVEHNTFTYSYLILLRLVTLFRSITLTLIKSWGCFFKKKKVSVTQTQHLNTTETVDGGNT